MKKGWKSCTRNSAEIPLPVEMAEPYTPSVEFVKKASIDNNPRQ